MEVQFEKRVIPCLRSVARDMQAQELTQEVRLSDGMPDIGKVLASWGQILVRGKQWHNGTAGVSGGIMVWVLYLPEEENEPRCVESWIPFQCKWDVSDAQRDGTICVQPILKGVDARSLSARKLMVRAGMGMLCDASVSSEAEVYTPTEVPEDVQLLKNTYPVQIPSEAGEKTFFLEEMLSLPGSASELAHLIRYTLRPELLDKKVVADKVIMRGMCVVNILYRSTDGQLCSWDFEVPFSQYAQLDKEYDTGAEADIIFAVTDLELEQAERNLNLKSGLTGQYTIFDRQVLEMIEDAYSPRRDVTVQTSQSALPTVLDMVSQTVSAEQRADTDCQRVVDVTFYPAQVASYPEENRISTHLAGMFQMLGYDSQGQLQSATAHWEDSWDLPASEDAYMQTTLQQTGRPQAIVNGTDAEMRADMLISGKVLSNSGMRFVTGLQIGDMKEPDENRPSLIVRRTGEDRLWDIAKDTGSTVDAIMQANRLQREPDSEQILLIPIS